MKKLVLGVVLALVAAWCIGRMTAAAEQPPAVRALDGLVTNDADVPLNKAIVYLKNTKTLAVKSYITSEDGLYRFPALSPNVDYEVHAEYQGKKSGTKTLSSFDSRKAVRINLKIDVGK